MKKLAKAAAILMITLVISVNLHAQNNEEMKYVLFEVEVTPVQMEKGIEAIKAENEFYKKVNYPYPTFTQYSGSGYMWYAVPFKNYAELDKMVETGKKLWTENGEELQKIQKMFDQAYTNVSRMIIEYKPELSIPMEQTGELQTGKKFRVYEKFHIKPGKIEDFKKNVKKYIELLKKHGYTDAMLTFLPVFGPDINVVYFINEGGENPAEHYKINDEQWKKFGEEGMQLWEEVKPLIEKTETYMGQIDYDIMYMPSGN